MWPTWWWPQALMQPEILILQLADVVQLREVGEAARHALRHRDRARVGEVAVVEPRAGDDVADQAVIRGREIDCCERLIERQQVLVPDVGQHEVLLVADADFVEA